MFVLFLLCNFLTGKTQCLSVIAKERECFAWTVSLSEKMKKKVNMVKEQNLRKALFDSATDLEFNLNLKCVDKCRFLR